MMHLKTEKLSVLMDCVGRSQGFFNNGVLHKSARQEPEIYAHHLSEN